MADDGGVKIPIQAEDEFSPAFQAAINATGDLENAVRKLLVQEQVNASMKEATGILDQMSPAERKAALEAINLSEAQKKSAASSTAHKLSLTDLKSGLDMVISGLETAKQAFDAVMEAGAAGANLNYAQQRFDRLSESIGITSDALMGKLRTSTRGMVADSDLVASAGDLMSLGLAKTTDQVVRLTRVSGALGMDMNQLVLTLANQTTMRFDQLGVAVDGFDERLGKLKATGMDTNAAFTEAFLQQAEAQVQRIGEKADSAAADYAKFEVATKNLEDANKKFAATALKDVVPALTQMVTATTASMDAQAKGMGRNEFIATQKALQAGAQADKEWSSGAREAAVAARAQTQDTRQLGTGVQNASWQMTIMRQREDEIRAAAEKAASAQQHQANISDRLRAAQGQLATAQANLNESMGDKWASKLEAAGLKGKKLEDALSAVDRTFGTQTLATKKANDAMDEALKTYQRTGDISSFGVALQGNKSDFEKLDPAIQSTTKSIKEAQVAWNVFYGQLSSANGSEFRVKVNVDYTSGAYGKEQGGQRTDEKYGGIQYATGGQFVIPPGYNETWPVGPNRTASSGETVTITPPGKAAQSSVTVNIRNLNLPQVTNANQLVAELGKLANQAMSSGAGTMGVL